MATVTPIVLAVYIKMMTLIFVILHVLLDYLLILLAIDVFNIVKQDIIVSPLDPMLDFVCSKILVAVLNLLIL